VRVAFLVQVRELRQQAAAAQSADLFPVFTPPVSVHQKGRLNEWITFFQHLFGKEPSMILKPAIALFVSLSLILGSAAVTASAAQNSLPDEPLYAVKLLTEDVRLDLASNARSRLDLTLAFSERRVNEMVTQQQLGRPVNAGLGDRWQQQMDRGLQAAASMTDAELPGALQQTRQGLLQQEHALQQAGGPGAANKLIVQTRQQVQECLRLVEAGLQNPLHSHRETPGQTEQPGACSDGRSQTAQPGIGGSGQSQGPALPTETAGGYGSGVQQGTPQPGSGYGPGNASQTPLGPGYGQPQQTPGAGTAGNGNGKCSGECSGNMNGSNSDNENDTGAGNGASTGGSGNGSDTGGTGGSGAGGSGGSGGGGRSGGGRP